MQKGKHARGKSQECTGVSKQTHTQAFQDGAVMEYWSSEGCPSLVENKTKQNSFLHPESNSWSCFFQRTEALYLDQILQPQAPLSFSVWFVVLPSSREAGVFPCLFEFSCVSSCIFGNISISQKESLLEWKFPTIRIRSTTPPVGQ